MAIETVAFESGLLGRVVEMNVLVPATGKSRYPAVYFQHGLGDTYATFFECTDLEAYGRDIELIIVTPDGGDGWYCNDPREGGIAWEDHIATEVVQHVEANFPAIDSRKGRAMAGFSMGGYGAMMLAMKHANRFAAVCTQAGSFAFGHELRPDRPERSAFMQAVAPPGGKYDLFVLAERFSANAPTAPDAPSMAIRFDVGAHDHLLEHNRRFHARLDELGIDHEYEEVEGGHEWRTVDRQLPTTLRFVTEHLAAAE